jgi:type II secretory pathway pseudopilin PulG
VKLNSVHFDFGGSRVQALRQRSAFSLIEILVAAALLTFIVLGLMAMFNQTQRAFRSSMTQTDVLESGRATLDMLARELEQMAPSQEAFTTNFLAEPSAWFSKATLQDMPGTEASRTNTIQKFFFLTRFNTEYVGVGYQVMPESPEFAGDGVGSLYRFAEGLPTRFGAQLLCRDFYNVSVSNMNRIADGIVHLRVRAFDAAGRLIAQELPRFPDYTVAYTNMSVGSPAVTVRGDQAAIFMTSNAVPAFVELELGVLEPQILRRYRSIQNITARLDFLARYAPNVHVFRQRIPVRNVDISAYQ